VKGASKDDSRNAAHAVVAVVRQAINENRNGQWAGIVRARNRLLRTSLFTGLAAFCFWRWRCWDGASQALLVGAVVFYLAGGLVGLIARLRGRGSEQYGHGRLRPV